MGSLNLVTSVWILTKLNFTKNIATNSRSLNFWQNVSIIIKFYDKTKIIRKKLG